jgi:hypothetical protein
VHYLTASANVVSPAGLASTGVADVAPGSVGGLLLLVFGFVLLALVWLGRSRRQQRRV